METSAMGLETAKEPVLEAIGNYDLLEKIAEGGMGAIYKGRQRDTGLIVAIKIMPAHMASNAVLLKRFEQEFRAASRLDHPNIVRALDYGDSGATPYLVMEFVDGESLGQRLDRSGRIPEAEAIRIIGQVAQGLHRAHKQNLVHRDVKPDNVLITSEGTAKLADLGLVKETETDLNLTKTGRGLGTPHFMAPEQFRNAKNADIRCDIYSLGATLYQMVTGELPFRSNGPLDAWMKKIQNDLTPPRQLVPTLSERIEWAILRAMSADPANRPSSCREFVEDLTGHSTRRSTTHEATTAAQDLWYLVYKDEAGVTHTVKGTTGAIRRSLRDGLLGDAANIRASRTKVGPFESLRGFPEFRDLAFASLPAAAPPSGPSAKASRSADAGTGEGRPKSQAPSTPEAEVLPETDSDAPAPHISLEDSGNGSSFSAELLWWIFLVLLAGASAFAAYFYFFRLR
jgi:eukaryotic-like serine/threonine-protein kinase